MAIATMQKLGIYALKSQRKNILEYLQKEGVMEIDTKSVSASSFSLDDFSTSVANFKKIATMFDESSKIIKKYSATKRQIALNLERQLVSRSKFEEIVDHRTKYYDIATDIIDYDSKIEELTSKIQKKEIKIQALEAWYGLDIPLIYEGTENTRAFIGSFQNLLSRNQIIGFIGDELAISEDEISKLPVIVEVISSMNQVTNACIICTKDIAPQVEKAIRKNSFSSLPFMSHRIPADAISKRRAEIDKYEEEIEEYKKKISAYDDLIENFRIAYDYYSSRADKYMVLSSIGQTKGAFIIEGWVAQSEAEKVISDITDKFDSVCERIDKREDELEPTLLINNSFSTPAESVLESYGLPTHGRVDPTFVMNIFYIFFFGMMLSDAGYGLLMSIVCFIVQRKFRRLSDGIMKMVKLFFWCGLSTAFWGVMFGGFFGDAIDVIGHTFFDISPDVTIFKPVWLSPLDEPMKLLVYCLLFGLIHLFAGLAMKGYEYLKEKDFAGFFGDVIAWYLFITGLVLILIPTELFKAISSMDVTLPSWASVLSKILTFAGMGTILLMSGRANKNWGLRIALGAYDLYNITGWLSDVLSYSRLLALGLATGVIASVINMMAAMVGKSVLGVIVFIVVFIFGHLINLLINLLGAYVHTNRLQYVEFFGKFYDAGGRLFKPFKHTNKYVDIKEEN